MENKRINWIKIGIEVLAVFVFILLLVWLFPFGSKKDNKGSNFGDNFDTYRESARKYYTEKNLPKDTEKLTLQDLIDKKAVRKLYDKTGKSCDTEKSYTRITKITDNEYQLRIDLTCGNESDYVLETIKFETKIDDDNNNTNNNTANNNSNNNNNTNNNGYSNTIAKTKLTQYRYYKKEIIRNTTYKCEDGYILDGKYCVKASQNTAKATEKYSEEKTLTMEATKNIGGTKTIYADVIITDGNPQKYCEKGSIGADGKCHTSGTTQIDAETNTRTWCDNGDRQSGNKCIHSYEDSYAASETKSYTGWSYSSSIDVTSPRSSNDTTRYDLKGTYLKNECTTSSTCINYVTHYKYDVYKRSIVTNYSCPNGGSQRNGRCYIGRTSEYDVHRETTYYCKDGSTPVNKKCTVTTDIPFDPVITYTKDYKCPEGYNSKGSGLSMVCYKQVKDNDTFYCSDASYTLDTNTNKCYKKVPRELIGYDCPSGYTLNGTMCYGNAERIPAKPWTICTILTSYTWNSKTVLEGWTRTEGTRVIEI